MSFEYEKYLRVIKSSPALPSLEPYLELTSRAGMSWEELERQRELKRRAEEEAQYRAQHPLYPDISGYVWPDEEGMRGAIRT